MQVTLDYDEFLTSVHVYYGKLYEDDLAFLIVIFSLTLKSNIRSYGSFGPEMGNYFPRTGNGGKTIGFND